jgi:hypothetical protein
LSCDNTSATKIGQNWTSEDHKFLLTALARIDQICIDVWNQIHIETRTAPKRLDELLSLDPEPPPAQSDVLDLPFEELTGDPEL